MKLGKSCPRYAEFSALYPSSARLRKALCDYYAAIIRLCKYSVEFLRRPGMFKKLPAKVPVFDKSDFRRI